MARRGLGALTLDLIARTGGFIDGMTKAERQAKKSTDKMGVDFERLAKRSRSAVTSIAKAGVGVALAVSASLTGMYHAGAQSTDQLAKMSDQIGITTEDLGGLRYAAQQMAGMADGTFDVSLRRMTRRLAEAAEGGGPAANALKALRLEAADLARMSPDQQFRAIADAMKGIPDQGQRLRATMAIFDTQGVPLVNALSQGADAIREMEQEASSLGITVSRIDAAKVEQANDAMARNASIMRGFTQQLAVQFSPVVTGVIENLTGVSDGMGGMGKTAERVFKSTVRAIGFVADALHGVRVVAKLVVVGFQGLGNAQIGIVSMMLEGWQRLFDFIVAGVENVIRTANRIPGVEIPLDGVTRFRGMLQGAASDQVAMRNQLSQSFAQSRKELAELVGQELPSERLKAFVNEVQQVADQAARSSLASRVVPVDTDVPDISVKQQEEINKRLDALRESFLTEEEMLYQKYEKEQELLRQAREAELATEEEYQQLSQASQQRYEDALTKIKQQGEKARMDAVRSALSSISTLMNGESRKLFEVGKMAAIADATVSMFQGIMKAWSLGPILGPPMAALVGAAGVQNIQGINKTKFGGGTAAVSNTQAINNAATGVSAQQAPPERAVYMHGIDPNMWYSGQQLLDVLNKELVSGGKLMGVSA